MTDTSVILPCLDEGPALRDLLPRMPAGYDVIVVDNGSTDDTVAVARAAGVRVVSARPRGYGAAVHAGVESAVSKYVVVMDADGSIDPRDIERVLAPVRAGAAELTMGRRIPAQRGVWPWHARWGNAAVLALVRRRTGLVVRDLGPLRAARRDAVLALSVSDRRMGYPLELLVRAAAAGWRVEEIEIAYHPRAGGTRSKVSGSVRGSLRVAWDFSQVLR